MEDLPLPEAYAKMERLIFAGAMGEVLERLQQVLQPENVVIN